jgi:cytochrome P450
MTQLHEDFSHVPAGLMEEINHEIAADIRREFSRRGLLRNGLVGAGAFMSMSLLQACKPREEASGLRDATGAGLPADAVIPLGPFKITGKSFYKDVGLIVAQTPITADVAKDPVEFKKQATVRGKAVGGVLKFWMSATPEKPYEMFAEMFARQKDTPVFQPGIGPVVVFQHPHVIDVLERCETFTVDPYAPMMQIATSGHHYPAPAGKTPRGTNAGGYYNHYMLGTDSPDLYPVDSMISRYVVKPDDIKMLRRMVRDICERSLAGIKSGDTFDVITTVGRLAPVLVVSEYLGLPSFAKAGAGGKGAWNVDNLKAGGSFDIDKDMTNRFKFQTITKGTVPTHQDMYEWVRDAFRNIFNNFERNQQFADAGLAASEKLLAWSAKVISVYKYRIQAGNALGSDKVPDTMITRLIKLQLDAKADPQQWAEKFNISVDELRVRTADDRVQVNAFGAFVGAVANPEEANGRIIDGILRVKEGLIDTKNGSYAEARRLAQAASSLSSDMSKLDKYAIELLRLQPQGEILLRACTKDSTIGGVPVRAGTTVFNAHGAAMRDANVIDDPLSLDITRDPMEKVPSLPKESRPGERPQSTIYLHHGYGRHKCLGRYASEITMSEVLRAVLRLGDIERVPGTKFELDKDNLYATSLQVKVL